MFSFFHRENIRFEFLTKSIVYPKIERDQQLKEQQREPINSLNLKRQSWAQMLKDLAVGSLAFLSKDWTPPVLPDVLRDIDGFDCDNEVRLRSALSELSQLSLITYNADDDNYSMHPVVHRWARERPDLSTMEQAIWCQATINTLVRCILLPPLTNAEEDERLRRDLLPHVDHVRERYQEIQETICRNRNESRRPNWLFFKATKTRTHITQLAKFSRVYAQCGRWEEAKRFQLEVKEFVAPLSAEHPSTIRIKLALSATCLQLGQGNEAAELQSQVVQAHTTLSGEQHPDTLKAIDILGESPWQQGQFTKSFDLHKRAFNGMSRILGPDRENTLKAADNLGCAHATLWRMQNARELHAIAVTGMRENGKLGPMHLDTLMAMDHLAMACLELNPNQYNSGEDLDHAYELMVEVLDPRKKKPSKEHSYRLWATANLARVKAAQGKLVEAESDIRAGLKIATRNLGPQHMGTLFVRQERIPEAIGMLIEAADGHRHMASANNGEHHDRVSALHHLALCQIHQGKLDEAVRACEEAVQGLTAIGGHAHPYMQQLNEVLSELQTTSRTRPVSERIPETSSPG